MIIDCLWDARYTIYYTKICTHVKELAEVALKRCWYRDLVTILHNLWNVENEAQSEIEKPMSL